jgi:hypothetical protein
MNSQQSKFLDDLRNTSPEEFRAKVEAAERAVKKRKAVRAFMRQLLVGLVIGLIIGGGIAGAAYLSTHGGF